MTGFSKFATNCERAREWSSLRLDGELPQLQRAMLRKHLAACAGCTGFDRDLAAATVALRTAPMELLERPVVIPRGRRSVLRIAPALAAAAAVVFVFGLGPLVQPHLFRSPASHASSIQRAPAGQASVEETLLHDSRVLMQPGIKRGVHLSV